MEILDRLFGPQLSNLSRSLDRATQRHALLTENLANVNVPGYKRKDIDFGIELESAESQGDAPGKRLRLGSGGASNESSGSIRLDGNSVDLEHEVAGLGETELRYEMLTQMTGNYFGNLKSVIREGR